MINIDSPEYQKLFFPSNIKNIEKDAFIEFLPFRNNHHWSGLQRQVKNLTSDMGALRKALSELLDDSKDIKDRINNIIRFKEMVDFKGLGPGIYTPILMIASDQKFAVQNSESEGFLSRYGISPDMNPENHEVEYYEEFNKLLNDLAKDAKIDLWTLDALFHYDYLYIKKIPTEIKRRKDLWQSMDKKPDGKVSMSELSLAKLRIGKKLREKVALRILITGTKYNNINDEGDIIDKFHQTKMQELDENGIEGMISAMNYQVPVFVGIGNKRDREVKIGLVRDYDKNEETFLVELFDYWPNQEELVFKTEDEPDTEFDPYSKNENRKKALNDIRPGQAKFRFYVVKRYGAKCAVCGVTLKEVLEAAHIVSKSEGGRDDSRNGLILCANHHRMFDSNLFAIDTHYKRDYWKGYNKDNLMIKVENLSRLADKPDKRAIIERYKMFKK